MLGVIEGRPENTIQGVGNISKTQISMWDMLSNPNKVNYRSVDNEDVHVVNIDGAEILIVCVKEAPESMKPVYFNGKRENTFIRTGDGDRRATKQELEAFERNAMPCHDSLPIAHFTMAGCLGKTGLWRPADLYNSGIRRRAYAGSIYGH
ncbi:MAG: hypothetical protein NC337_00415 [Roseburia sp.]|nr:hypothetical protein [Roseburia sp.]